MCSGVSVVFWCECRVCMVCVGVLRCVLLGGVLEVFWGALIYAEIRFPAYRASTSSAAAQ